MGSPRKPQRRSLHSAVAVAAAGLAHGLVGAVFWGLGAVAAAGLALSFLGGEGDGHEIRLEGGDEGEKNEAEAGE